MKPILFSTPMVQAILEGRKTQTRRIVKFPNDFDGKSVYNNSPFGLKYTKADTTISRLHCLYGNVGDILWVREKWQHNRIPSGSPYFYYADESVHDREHSRWKPSIHMPKDACRLFLKIIDIWGERLQEINEADAIAEGIEYIKNRGSLNGWKNYITESCTYSDPTLSFESLWIKINGKESWNANPWVWGISFKSIEKPIE